MTTKDWYEIAVAGVFVVLCIMAEASVIDWKEVLVLYMAFCVPAWKLMNMRGTGVAWQTT